MIFLQLLGYILLFILLWGGFNALRNYLLDQKNKAENSDFYTLLGVLPPLTLKLESCSDFGWIKQQQRDQHQLILKKNGFQHSGYFQVNIGETETLMSFWCKPAQGLSVALVEVRDQQEGGIVASYTVDVFLFFTDDSSLSVTNNRKASILPRPKEHVLKFINTDDIKQLFASIKPSLPADKKIKPVVNVSQLFIDRYQLISEWIWEEAQLRSVKLQAAVKPLDIEIDDRLVGQLLDYVLDEKNELISQRILERISRAPSMTAEKWEKMQGNLVVVHANMQAHDIVNCLYQLLGQINEEDEAALEELVDMGKLENPIALFEEQLQALKGGRKIKKITSTSQPVAACVYTAG